MESKQLKKLFVTSLIFFVLALEYASSAEAEVVTPNATVPEIPSEPKQTCVCDGALLPRRGENGKEIEICPHCKCKYENRNTTLIKVVVIIVIWIISILVIYMLFLMCLDPLLNKRVKANYQEHTNEDDDTTSVSPQSLPNSAAQELNARANVLNRVGHQQDKWKKQVREQRRHIYDRRTMLN
ncbi:uncharacterized protein CG1161 [Eupeodes corollae]|uniref:uncharacterized protein CG1161 n=1 Tax=Eupeodes corollae TaxID=290404 RepID=UPI00249163EF|nr:uncharacterized protein CG1161 [Eupeodes corollae]